MKVLLKNSMWLLVVMLSWYSHSEPELQQFELVKLQLGDKAVQVQLADTPIKRAQGLMFQETADPGMFLLYKKPQEISLWMANTTIPLDVAFIGADWTIRQITQLQPLDETPVPSPGKVIAALEMPQGWFKQHGIKEGAKVTLSK